MQSNPLVESRVVPPSSSQVHRESISQPTNSLPQATATAEATRQPSGQIGLQSSRAGVTSGRSTDIQLIVSTTSSQLPSPFPKVLNHKVQNMEPSSAMIPVQATFARCEGDASRIVDEQQVSLAFPVLYYAGHLTVIFFCRRQVGTLGHKVVLQRKMTTKTWILT